MLRGLLFFAHNTTPKVTKGVNNMFDFLARLGGCLVVLDWCLTGCKSLYRFIKKYREYKDAYKYLKEEDNKDNIKSMGFKTKKEQEEIEAKLRERYRA